MKALFKNHFSTVLLFSVFIVSWIVLSFCVDGFGSFAQISNILQISGLLGIAAAGQNLVILTGNFDLSIGAMISFSGVLFALGVTDSALPWGALAAITLGAGALMGLFNGVGVSLLKIPPLVMTLASGSIFSGLALVVTQGMASFAEVPVLQSFVNDKWFFGLNGIVFVWVIVAVVIIFLLKKTVLGKKIIMTGSNETSARISGIPTRRIVLALFVCSGILSAVVGLLLVGFTGKSYFGMGDTYQFMSLAAVVVGGTSIMGGKGDYLGTVAGALLLTLIQSALTLFKIPYGGQLAIQGLIIFVLVVVYSYQQAEKRRKLQHI